MKCRPASTGGEACVVTRQPPEAGQPGETALDHPTAGQQHEPTLGLSQVDDFQLDAVRCCRLGDRLAGVARINPRQLDVVARHRLHLLRQRLDLVSFVLIGGRNDQGEQQAETVDRRMGFGTLTPFCPL